jgi:hypothetical protein
MRRLEAGAVFVETATVLPSFGRTWREGSNHLKGCLKYDPALKPVGLYVEQGRELVHVNTRSGYGNFPLKPNGIFYVSGDKAAVAETSLRLRYLVPAYPCHQAPKETSGNPVLVLPWPRRTGLRRRYSRSLILATMPHEHYPTLRDVALGANEIMMLDVRDLVLNDVRQNQLTPASGTTHRHVNWLRPDAHPRVQ